MDKSNKPRINGCIPIAVQKRRFETGRRQMLDEAIRKLLFLATRDITKKWTMPIFNWAAILNQLVIRFEDRLSL